jgi:NTE family protein
VVRALAEHGTEYDLFCGTSVGAINAVGLAQRPTLAEGAALLTELWERTKTEHVARKRFLAPLCLLWAPSIYTVDPLRKLLHEHVDFDAVRRNGKQLRVVSVNLESGLTEAYGEFATKEALVEAVMASSVAPIIYPPVEIGGVAHLDGGIRETSPIAAAIDAGATSVDLVLCESAEMPRWSGKTNTALGYATRVLGVMLHEITENDIKTTYLHNMLRLRNPEHTKRMVELRVFRPKDGLPADSTQFDPNVARALIRQGYLDGLRGLVQDGFIYGPWQQ